MNKLTESSIRKAETSDKQYKIYDGDGMFLLIHPNGSKYWRMKYTFDGKSKLASFGVWPRVSLKEAREMRQDAKQKIKSGINPVEEKRKNKKNKIQQSIDKNKDEKVHNVDSDNSTHKWYKLMTPQGRVKQTAAAMQSLKSFVLSDKSLKPVSSLRKDDLTEILGNIIRNRKDLFNIIWDFYQNIPVLNLAVLFVLLLIVMDFFPALITTILYFSITVCATAAFGLWEEKKMQD